jgi:cobalt-precorrin 5A hydrolase / cobalt-factor III methyltransferase / precorrin-3B C17-methyltransferase
MEEIKIEIYALTEAGTNTAAKLAEKLSDVWMILPAKFKSRTKNIPGVSFFKPGEFTAILETNWDKFDAHIFIMATGIVVRKTAQLLKDKTVDPAVVVCDEKGDFAISLLSGHIGGANRLAKNVAGILGGQAVITTATDVQGIMAFDELAAINNWKIKNPENIKILNSMLLEAKPIALMLPEAIYKQYYSERKKITHVSSVAELEAGDFAGAVILGAEEIATTCLVLYLEQAAEFAKG